MNMTRSMLIEAKVPREFWAEAATWAVHVLNRSPTTAVMNKTPEEAWSEVKPSIEHFKIFGCIGHVHNPEQKRRKLDDKSVKCVHLGISFESKAYKMYNPITKKMVISGDVVFEESEKWDWNSEETST